MKKWISMIAAVAIMTTGLAACGSKTNSNKMITVVSREDGSGTRTAFIELFGLQEKAADGTKVDKTTKEALIANKTDVMLTQVAGNEFAIGYLSMGSLNDTIKAVNIDGVAPTVENVKNGTYKISRPFLIAVKKDAAGGDKEKLQKDFINFILSADGQKVIEDNLYIKVQDSASAFQGTKPSGKLVVGGSSSVTPVMEKLKEAYATVNPNATIEVQQSDSSTGLKSGIDGTIDIAMSSRDLTEDEKTKLQETKIATDGIAVIVNKANPVSDLKKTDVSKIFSGGAATWADISSNS